MLQYQEQKKMGNEKFHASSEGLSFSDSLIQITAMPGEIKEGSFTIYGPTGESVGGFVTSSRLCMKCVTTSFAGSKEVINYRFDGASFRAGDQIEGYFRIISDHGEYQLPFRVSMAQQMLSSSLGPMRNLVHFTNLARSSWKEAVDLFYNPAFASVFTAAQQKEYGLYRGLSRDPGNQQNVEEFLIACGRKQAVEFIPDHESIEMDVQEQSGRPVSGILSIRKNGWGYTNVRLESDCSFLSIDRMQIDADSFDSGTAQVTFTVNPAKMHYGSNFGSLIMKMPSLQKRIPVTVRYCDVTAIHSASRRQYQETILKMMNLYMDFRMRHLDNREFLEGEDLLIRRLKEMDRNHELPLLYRIHYLVSAGQYDDAESELIGLNVKLSGGNTDVTAFETDQYELEDNTDFCYRLYLCALTAQAVMKEDDEGAMRIASDALQKIEEIHREEPENWWVTWLLLYLSDEYEKRPYSALEMLMDQFEMGCHSPILYLEALDVYLHDPSMLHELNEFEQQVLLFAARHNLLNESLMTQVNVLSRRQKTYSDKLFHILCAGYECKSAAALQNETLESIVRILIRGNMTGEKYFSWYRLGVAAELSITSLYEYYMLSLPADFDGQIPQAVMMYFAWQSSLPYEKNAFLYRYFLEHEQDYESIYEQYIPQISDFVQNMMLQNRMNSDLAYLYTWYLQGPQVLSVDLAKAAVRAVFTCLIRTTDPAMKRVVVVYDKCRQEQSAAIQDYKCYLPIYGEENHIFFEDGYGNRYAVPFTIDRLMNYQKFARELEVYGVSDFGYDLYLAEGKDAQIGQDNLDHYLRLAESGELIDSVRSALVMRILRYYSDNDYIHELDEYLDKLDPADFGAEDRSVLIRYMSVRGMYRKAMSWLYRYGTFGVDGSVLVSLCSGYLDEEEITEDADFANIAFETFRKGNFDDVLLQYMSDYFDGLTSELESVRKADLDYGISTSGLCRRMLIQMLYTGEQLPDQADIIHAFLEDGEDADLMASILAQMSHYYFIDGKPMSDEAFNQIARYGQNGEPLLDICRIAWLSRMSQHSGEIRDTDLEVTSLFLTDLMNEDIIFPFFRQFIGILPQLQAFADETLVEYRTKGKAAGSHIVYHYAMEKNGRREQYKAREMKQMYEGVYVTGFILFFGEQMHYYITDDAAEKNVLESGTIGQDARIPEESADRFGRINKICMLTVLGRDEEAIDRILQYEKTAMLTKNLFS